MDDLISRQAAIDVAKDWYDGLICGSFRGLEKRLKSLPPAQPEIQNDFCSHAERKGCWNCVNQIEPMRMCEWAERGGDGCIHWICPKWERRKDERSD